MCCLCLFVSDKDRHLTNWKHHACSQPLDLDGQYLEKRIVVFGHKQPNITTGSTLLIRTSIPNRQLRTTTISPHEPRPSHSPSSQDKLAFLERAYRSVTRHFWSAITSTLSNSFTFRPTYHQSSSSQIPANTIRYISTLDHFSL